MSDELNYATTDEEEANAEMREERQAEERRRRHNLANKKYRENNKDKAREYQNRWYKKKKSKKIVRLSRRRSYKKNGRKISRKHNALLKKLYHSNPIYKMKVKARSKANRIKIPNGQKCEICKVKLAREKHHEDYNKPLEVKFLCKSCHLKADGRRK